MPRRSPPRTILSTPTPYWRGESQAGIADVVLGQAGHKIHGHAEIGQRHGHVGLAPAIDHVERRGLGESANSPAATGAS